MQPGYEFVNGKPVPRPDYDYERVLSLAGPADEYGISILDRLVVAEGETAWNPGSTKHVIHGPAVVRYEIHPEGVRGIILDGGA